MIIREIKKIDDNVMQPVLTELADVNWDTVYDLRSKNPTFYGCKTIHLRITKPPLIRPLPTEVLKWAKILDIIDHTEMCARYPSSYKFLEWMANQVGGISIGRAMIVNLYPRTSINHHIDPGEYHLKFSRFHVPLVTNSDVLFSTNIDSVKEHMKLGYIYQLNNLGMHGVENNGNNGRIHIIADIEVPGGNREF